MRRVCPQASASKEQVEHSPLTPSVDVLEEEEEDQRDRPSGTSACVCTLTLQSYKQGAYSSYTHTPPPQPHREARSKGPPKAHAPAARKRVQTMSGKVCGINRRCLCYGIGAVLVPVVVIASLVGVYYPNGECGTGGGRGRQAVVGRSGGSHALLRWLPVLL